MLFITYPFLNNFLHKGTDNVTFPVIAILGNCIGMLGNRIVFLFKSIGSLSYDYNLNLIQNHF